MLNPVLTAKILILESDLTRIHQTIYRAALASSLSMEDQVIVDVIARLQLNNIEVFTLNTGRLHSETLAVIDANKTHYGLNMTIYTPQTDAVLHYVSHHGENAFYESVELRKKCCNIRKIEPLRRALTDREGWITGQRREQGITRTELLNEEFDSTHQLRKFNPLANWTMQDISDYILYHNVPINALHAKNYPSIGCEPCTRAIKPNEDQRAGRWWWENADSKECGLHNTVNTA
ncbi:MAG: Thioredoxin-dependent 5-adenylylsulfate reductase [Pseudomonadota bacterium]|jgi:phosphoadenosine phosphosulfate reductase